MSVFFTEDESNNITANRAFEVFVLDVLRDYLSSCEKRLFDSNNLRTVGFDAFAPDGVFDDVPTYIEIKNFTDQKKQYFQSIYESSIFQKPIQDTIKVLLIVGTLFSQESKDQLANFLNSRTGATSVVWDYHDFKKFVGPIYDKYYNSEFTAAKYLVRYAINERETDTQRTIQKKNTISLLRQKYQNESIVLVLGAGVSHSAGIPNWNDLIIQLQTNMILHLLQKNRDLKGSKISEIVALSSTTFESSPIAQMRFIRSALNPDEYHVMVHDALYHKKPRSKTRLLDSICTISIPDHSHVSIDSIITYNFDDLLECALDRFKIKYNVVSQEKDNCSIRKLNVFHAHGYLPNEVDDFSIDFGLIFSEEDYHQVYKDSYCWSNLIQINSFRDKTCVFIGSSLTDPNLRRLLDISSRQDESPHHFAFLRRTQLPVDSGISVEATKAYLEIDENLKNNYYNTLGINIIWIDDFEEIPDILLSLRQ